MGQDRSLLMAQISHPGDIMAEYDSPSHMPEGVTHNMWERLVAARRKKVENEQKVLEQLNYSFLKVHVYWIGQIYGTAVSRNAIIFTKPNCRR